MSSAICTTYEVRIDYYILRTYIYYGRQKTPHVQRVRSEIGGNVLRRNPRILFLAVDHSLCCLGHDGNVYPIVVWKLASSASFCITSPSVQ